MPVEINITDADVTFASNLLLHQNNRFDNERITFIKKLDTIDLQAVPGSGKTTALLAKLLILERHLPFNDGSGILVISHTNAAVDEIESKIRKYCPQLFSAPNFVGTIQKFTNEFLAIPFYSKRYEEKIHFIDDDIYNTYVQGFSFKNLPGFTQQEQNNAKRYLHNNDLYKKFRYSHINGQIVLTNGYNGAPLDFVKPKGNTHDRNYLDWTDQEKQAVRAWLFAFKKSLFKSGVLCFDDAYCLAFEYLIRFPRIKTILQKRFQYVFVDEMQDMERHQHDLLEEIFFENGNSTSKYQRIGDKNQAIYSHNVAVDEIWSDRETTLTINGSHRLTPQIADLVNCFALHRAEGFQVRGLREGDILPHIIIYTDATIGRVIHKYSEIIHDLLTEGRIPPSENKFKAIAWVKAHEGDLQKIGLTDYFPEFDRVGNSSKIDYPSLSNYLHINTRYKNSLNPIQDNIIEALLKVLRLENIETEKRRQYTKSLLFTRLKESNEPFFNEFKLNLFQWSIALARGENVINRIRAYIPQFLFLFGRTINNSNEFISAEAEDDNTRIVTEKINTINYHGFDIEIATIHSEKGRTHSATLYLETFYNRGQGNYESERLRNQFMFSNLNPRVINVVKQSAKMMYVGISRPTHLLCIAVHENRFNENLFEIDTRRWVIRTI